MTPVRLMTAAAALAFLSASPSLARSAPRLGVLVVFDQMPADALDHHAPLFSPGGFGGLEGRGAARYDAQYTYAVTETGPGHATVSTGANPPVHGICGNRWKDGAGKQVYCVAQDDGKVLGNDDAAGVGPANLRALTLADAVKLSTRGRGRVVTVSIKDRAAILTAGQSGDLAIFYDVDQGRYTTSKAYADTLPGWLETLGKELPQTAQREGKWSPLPLPRKSTFVLPADDQPGESERYGWGRTFPHHLSLLPDVELRRKAYRGSPQALDDLITLGLKAIDEEKLGTDDDVDLLVLALSPTDFVGHWYGPESLEATEMLRHADLALRRLTKALDRQLGANRWTLALTADHGIAPKPDQSTRKGIDAVRIQTVAVEEALQAAAAEILGPDATQPYFHPPHLFLDIDAVAADKRDALLDRLQSILEGVKGIEHVYRADRLHLDHDPYLTAYAQSMADGRCDAMMVRQRPGSIFAWKTSTGADHGTPYVYDNRVPLFLVGPGVRRGRYAQAVDPRDVAVTLAFLMHIAPPASAQGHAVSAVGAEATLPLLGQ